MVWDYNLGVSLVSEFLIRFFGVEISFENFVLR